MTRAKRWWGAAGLTLVLPLAGCPSSPPAPPVAESVTAKPVTSAPAASASASAAAPSVTHAPGTVPAPKPLVKPADPPAAPSVLSKVAAAKSRKAGKDASLSGFVGRGPLAAISSEGALEIVDVRTGAGFSLAPITDAHPTLLTDETRLLVVEGSRTTLWDVAKGVLLRTFPEPGPAFDVSPDGKQIALGSESRVTVRDLDSGTEIVHFDVDRSAFEIVFGAGGKELVVESNNTTVDVFSLPAGTKVPGGGGAETGATFGIALSPDGRYAAASAPAGHGLQLFEVHAWGPRTLVVVPEGACQEHVAPWFSRDGKHLYASGGQRWVKGFEVGSFKPYGSYHAPPGKLVAATAQDLSRAVITMEEGKKPAVVNVGNGAETALEKALSGDASYSLSADGNFVGGSAGGVVRVWDAKTGKVVYEEMP
jgi:WD40 repeat protein